MKVMQKRIYDKGDNILNSYQFEFSLYMEKLEHK